VTLRKQFLDRLHWLSDDDKLALRWLVGDFVPDSKGANNYRRFLSGEDERKARKIVADKLRGRGDVVLNELAKAISAERPPWDREEAPATELRVRTLQFTDPKKTPDSDRKIEVAQFIIRQHRDNGLTINKCFDLAAEHFGLTRRTVIKYWKEHEGAEFHDDQGEPESME
jgi:hypothetical protein